MVSANNYYNVDTIVDYLVSKYVLCEYNFEETFYYKGLNDITTINTSIGKIKFTENVYTNVISMYYKGEHYESIDIILKELENNIP